MEALFKEVDADYRRKLLDVLPHQPTARLLDVGCDDGAWTAELATRIAPALEPITEAPDRLGPRLVDLVDIDRD